MRWAPGDIALGAEDLDARGLRPQEVRDGQAERTARTVKVLHLHMHFLSCYSDPFILTTMVYVVDRHDSFVLSLQWMSSFVR